MEEASLNFCFYLSLQGVFIDPRSLLRELGDCKTTGKTFYLNASRHLRYKSKDIIVDKNSALSRPVVIDHPTYGPCVLVRQEKDLAYLFQARLPSMPITLSSVELYETWTGEALTFEKRFSSTYLFDIVKKYGSLNVVGLIVATSLLVQVFAIAIPLFSQIIVDKVLVHQNQSALYVFGVLMIVMVCAELAFSIARIQITIESGKKIDAAISYRVHESILEKPLSFFQESRVGNLVAMARKADIVSPLILSGTLFNALDMVFTVVFFAIMIGYSGTLALLCFGMVLLISGFNFWAIKSSVRDEGYNDPSVDLTESLYGIESIKLSGREGRTLKKLEIGIVARARHTAKTALRSNILLSFNMWMQRMGMLATLWIGATLVLDGKMSMGQLIAFQMFASRVFHPAARMAYTIKELRKAFFDYVELAAKINVERVASKHYFKSIEKIEMKNVTFAHGAAGALILNGINLTVRQGEKVGIIGESGSGKSTLLKLIVNVYSPARGSVRVNGIDVRHLSEEQVRVRMALVPQQSVLFRGTVLENVAPLGSVAFNDRLFDCARLVEVDELIQSHPEGFDRLVSELGANYSGGQKQKLCLLRALMLEPDVLMLDESTSALDEDAEIRIHRRLISDFRAMTIITVSHRPKSLEGYDVIYRMVQGQLELVRAVEELSWV